MRISTRKDDPGYSEIAYSYQVFLDGEKVNCCHTADEEKGEIHCFVFDAEGRPVRDLENDGSIKSEIKYGDVRIKAKQEVSYVKSPFHEYIRSGSTSILRVFGFVVYRRVGNSLNFLGVSFNA